VVNQADLGTPDHQVLLEELALQVLPALPGRPHPVQAQAEHPVPPEARERLGRLVYRGPQEGRAWQVLADRQELLELEDPVDQQVRLVKRVFLVHRERVEIFRDRQEIPVHQDQLALTGQPVSRECRVPQDQRDLLPLALPAP